MAHTSLAFWKRCFGCTEDLGEYTRLDWDGNGPEETRLTDMRGETAHLCGALDWAEMFDYKSKPCNFSGQVAHINVLECQGLLSLLRRLRSRGVSPGRVLVFIDSRVVLGACAKGRSSARKLNRVLRKVAAECLGGGYTLDLVWVPTWANPGDVPSRGKNLAA